MLRRVVVLALALVGSLLITTCSRRTVDLSQRPCDNGACLDGYQCDSTTQLCITTGDACGSATRYLACVADATSCAGGCRTCENGHWSQCAVPAAPPECEPNLTYCLDSSHVATCGPVGYLETSSACDYGCTGVAGAAQCNECLPGRKQCRGIVFVDCSSEGKIVSETSCQSASSCTNVGACNESLGCTTLPQAPDGTPCDDGSIQDGDLCNSACVQGVCVAGANVDCDDGLACTADRCASTTGCRHDLLPDGTICRDRAGLCDVIETCDGTSAACPNDDVEPFGTACRPTAGDCDVEEACDGVSPVCPADTLVTAGTVCRAAQDACDSPDFCDGATAGCPELNGRDDGDFCGSSCSGTVLTTDTCVAHRCTGSTSVDCDDGQACNGAETCGTVGCVPGNGAACNDTCSCSTDSCTDPGLCGTSDFGTCTAATLSAPAASIPQLQVSYLQLRTDCVGQATNISCTASQGRYCLYGPMPFLTAMGGFTQAAGTVTRATCGDDATNIALNASPSSIDDCTDGVLRLAQDSTADLNPAKPIDATGFTDLRVHFKAALSNTTEGSQSPLEGISVRACCGGAGVCGTEIGIAKNGRDGGIDSWYQRPYASRSGFAAGPSLNGCSQVHVSLDWNTSATDEMAQIDAFGISGIGSPPLSVTDNGDGTYDVRVVPCGASGVAGIDITCTWTTPDGAQLTDTLNVQVP